MIQAAPCEYSDIGGGLHFPTVRNILLSYPSDLHTGNIHQEEKARTFPSFGISCSLDLEFFHDVYDVYGRCVHTCADSRGGAGTCVCVCLWRSGVDSECLPSLLSSLFYGGTLLWNLTLTDSSRLPGQLALRILFSPSRCWITGELPYSLAFMWIWGSEP